MSNWVSVLLEPVKTVLSQIGQFLLNVVAVLIILLVGWINSKIVRTLVTKVLRRADSFSERIGLDDLLAKGGISYSFSELLGAISYWVGLLITFMVAVNAIGLTIVATLLNSIVLYIPNVVVAIFVLVIGMFIATLLRNLVQTAANNAGLAQTKVLAKAVEVIVMVFAIIIALEQLGIGAKIIELTVSILLTSLGLGVALAFGLGCKEIAGRFVGDLIDKLKKK